MPGTDDLGRDVPTPPHPQKPKAVVSGDRIRLEFQIEDLAKQLKINRGVLVANGCNGCSSCS